MGRERGTFQNPANYEPLVAAPFDARTLVKTKANLIAADTWRQDNGEIWIYNGMLTVVCADGENNGLYILLNKAAFDQEDSWMKLADVSLINALEQRIDSIPTLENVQIIHGGDSNVEHI